VISSGFSGWRGIAGRLVREVQWSGWAATGDNGVTHWLNALNHRVLWDYWPDGSVKVMTNAADKKWTYEYDVGGGCCGGGGAGNTTVTDPLNRQVIETRSAYGLLTQVQRTSGALTRTRTITYAPGVVSADQEGGVPSASVRYRWNGGQWGHGTGGNGVRSLTLTFC